MKELPSALEEMFKDDGAFIRLEGFQFKEVLSKTSTLRYRLHMARFAYRALN